MVGRDSTDWLPTSFRTHTLGDIAISGSDLVGQEVTVAGHAEISRGRGGVCFLIKQNNANFWPANRLFIDPGSITICGTSGPVYMCIYTLV